MTEITGQAIEVLNFVALSIGYSVYVLGAVYALMAIWSKILDRIMRALRMHEFLLEQMGPWVQKKHAEREARRAQHVKPATHEDRGSEHLGGL